MRNRSGDRVGDMIRALAWADGPLAPWRPISRDMTSKNSVSVETGNTTLT